MALDDDIRVLSGVALFSGFTREQLRLMAFGAETIALAAGRKLYSEGTPADSAFVIVSGTVALYREYEGRNHVFSLEGPGAILGDLALIADTERMTSAFAETDVKLIRLSRSMFRRILEEFPETAETLHGRISMRLQEMLKRMEELASRLAR
ncbi:Crp/Fnr family transcriptional regulator [Nitratireductor luteus]|uniref:Crp/Fnr family transcriptional regulator n=1 Tax=Nitratireductor luteus TaxID=2976980 RepID=UPI00223FD59C|nr:cyclic nucleotide-binding domain-containing protein [Nitratireductor luteus]